MPHHKRAAALKTSLPSISSLLSSERSALASCTRAGKSALPQRAWAGHRCTILIITITPIITLMTIIEIIYGTLDPPLYHGKNNMKLFLWGK